MQEKGGARPISALSVTYVCCCYTAHHTFPAVPFHRLPELHAELERRLGYSPPTVGYVEFQRRFIAALARGPEPVEGVNEVGPAIRRTA